MRGKLKIAEKKELRRFGLVMAPAVALMLGVVVPWLWGFGFPVWPWMVATILAALAVLYPAALTPVNTGWMTIGKGLNWLISHVTLAFVYYAVILPIGVVMRLVGKDPISRNIEPHLNTYRVPVERLDRKHPERPY